MKAARTAREAKARVSKKKVRDVAFWRGVVAAGAKIESHMVTQFTSDAFRKWLGGSRWWSVDLGDLRLTHEDDWTFFSRDDDSKARKTYAFTSEEEAFDALEKHVAPDRPAHQDLLEDLES